MTGRQERYRSDIDGLRAIAVLPVVVFHVAQAFLRGGYVGVDIFFVISGYLISAQIVREVGEGRFSVARFYERRIRRIFPAHAVMMIAVTAGVWLWFLPSETRDYGAALVAAVASVSNLYFWLTTNYFGLSAEQLPLLHTWSLAVEEQFYLVFPPIVMLVAKLAPRRLAAVVLALLAGSLLLAGWAAYARPVLAFYLLPTRAWELLLGTVLAIGIVPAPRTAAGATAASATGLAIVAATMLFYTPGTVFPGFAAVPPCVGAGLMILAGGREGNRVSRLLSLTPVRFVGWISYSLYLWHWPVMVFQRTDAALIESPSKLVVRGAVILASLVLATLSWWLVERPTRDRRRVPTRPLMIACGAAAAGLVAAGIALVLADGAPGRFSPQARAVATYLDYDKTAQFRTGRCFLVDEETVADFDRAACLPALPGRPTYLLFGDSHAAALSSGLRAAFADANVLQVSVSHCLPVPVATRGEGAGCRPAVALAIDELPAARRIDAVWLVARWDAGMLPGLAGTIAAYRRRGIPVVVVGPLPEYQGWLPRLLAKAVERRDPGLPHRMMLPGGFALDRAVRRFAAAHDARYVSLADALCRDGRCVEYAAPGVPLLFDADHLTAAGSTLAATRIRDALAAASRPDGGAAAAAVRSGS